MSTRTAGQIVVQDDGDVKAKTGENVGVIFDPSRVPRLRRRRARGIGREAELKDRRDIRLGKRNLRYRSPAAWCATPSQPPPWGGFVARFADVNREPTKVRHRLPLKGGGMKEGVAAVVTGL